MRRLSPALLLAPWLAFAPAAQAACPADAAVASLAEALVAGRPAQPFPDLAMADAECARGKLIPLLARAWGPVVGYKAGLTSAAVQGRYGLNAPVRGSIFPLTLSLRDGEEVPARFGEAVTLGIEADLLVRVADEAINRAGRDHVAILRSIDRIMPFIEMPASGLSGTVDGPNLVAVNVSARLGVVGHPFEPQATPEFARRLATMTVVLTDDEREVARAQGSALLGHPLDVIPWLVADLARQGQRLRAGDIVSLGGFAPSIPAVAGHQYRVRYDGLLAGPLSVSVRLR